MPYKFVQGFERGYKHRGAWDARPQSSINVLIEESLRSPHSLEGECVEYVTWFEDCPQLSTVNGQLRGLRIETFITGFFVGICRLHGVF